jgi:adenosyl cobinamide kinase/adenosyl cobinamide phosphate guanylyltransferase
MPIDETRGARHLALVLGGARSGKSRHAEALVAALPPHDQIVIKSACAQAVTASTQANPIPNHLT